MEKYRLQQYEDGTFGYLGIDGDRSRNFTTDSYVVCTQGEEEDRDDFIATNGITFSENQYGSNERLDRLANSDDSDVRKGVAKQGYGLEKLINDEYEYVRSRVAAQGYGLDILINDKSKIVRGAVAEQGYGLDILYEDSDAYVKSRVQLYLDTEHLTLAEWVLQDEQSQRN